MKLKSFYLVIAIPIAAAWHAHAQSTAFTYQGRLYDGGNPANGNYDLTFTLFNTNSDGSVVAGPLTNALTGVTNGLFTVTLNFGDQFSGADRWLEIGARTNGGGTFAVLSPRQALSPTPYAIYAPSAGSVAGSNIVGNILPAQLPSDVAFRTGGNNFTGTQSISNGVLNVNSPGYGTATAIMRARAGDDIPLAVQDYSGNNLFLVTTNGANNLMGSLNLGAAAGGDSGRLNLNAAYANVTMAVKAGPGDVYSFFAQNESAGTLLAVATNGQVNIGGDLYTGGVLYGNGTGLTSLNAANLTGTVADVRLSSNVALRSGNTFTGTENFSSGVSVTGDISATGRLNLNSGGSATATSIIRARAGDNVPFAVQNSGAINIVLVNTNGNVGINTPSPARPLQIGGPVGTEGMLRLSSAGTNGAARSWDIGVPKSDNSSSGKFYSFAIQDTAAPDPAFLINWNTGFVGIGTTNPASKLDIGGEATMTVCNITSDRNAKEQFKSVNPRDVLAKVASLPITEWQYKTQGDARHIGPMAQDFREAFGLGRDDKHITSVDADGVALAAIQGLNEKMASAEESTNGRMERLKSENTELKARLDKLEAALNTLLDRSPR